VSAARATTVAEPELKQEAERVVESNETEQVLVEAKQQAEGGVDLLERLVDRLGGKAGVQAVFGAPVEREGITVIPVAKTRWAFGAGSGSGPAMAREAGGHSTEAQMAGGAGGGGAAGAQPVGYIEVGPGGARFRPIVEPYPSPLMLLAVGAMIALILRALARILRG
jgi:uncharacterized spore protein YtfJ